MKLFEGAKGTHSVDGDQHGHGKPDGHAHGHGHKEDHGHSHGRNDNHDHAHGHQHRPENLEIVPPPIVAGSIADYLVNGTPAPAPVPRGWWQRQPERHTFFVSADRSVYGIVTNFGDGGVVKGTFSYGGPPGSDQAAQALAETRARITAIRAGEADPQPDKPLPAPGSFAERLLYMEPNSHCANNLVAGKTREAVFYSGDQASGTLERATLCFGGGPGSPQAERARELARHRPEPQQPSELRHRISGEQTLGGDRRRPATDSPADPQMDQLHAEIAALHAKAAEIEDQIGDALLGRDAGNSTIPSLAQPHSATESRAGTALAGLPPLSASDFSRPPAELERLLDLRGQVTEMRRYVGKAESRREALYSASRPAQANEAAAPAKDTAPDTSRAARKPNLTAEWPIDVPAPAPETLWEAGHLAAVAVGARLRNSRDGAFQAVKDYRDNGKPGIIATAVRLKNFVAQRQDLWRLPKRALVAELWGSSRSAAAEHVRWWRKNR